MQGLRSGMSKIVEVSADCLTIAFADGSKKVFPINSCEGFIPIVGMEVDVLVEGAQTVIRLVGLNGSNRTMYSDQSCFNDIPKFRPFTANNYSQVRVQKIPYLLLAFFFGCFGIHRFFAGKVKSGIIYLLCSTIGAVLVIPAIVIFVLVIIDFVSALFKPADDDGYFVL